MSAKSMTLKYPVASVPKFPPLANKMNSVIKMKSIRINPNRYFKLRIINVENFIAELFEL